MSNQNGQDATACDEMLDLLIRRWGVRHVFGLPGDGVNGFIDALRKRRHEVQFVQVRHEEAAALAAVGYAKFTGKLGVCMATSGPGAAHLLNGLMDARVEMAPVLAITGLQFSDMTATHFMQDFDTVKLYGDVCVYSERVMQPAHVENVTNLAVRYALSRRGPSFLGIPIDIQVMPASQGWFTTENARHHTSGDWSIPEVVPTRADLERAAAVLNAGKKVAILIGAGSRGARAEIEQVAEALDAPVVKDLLGKDVIPDDSPYTTGGMAIIGTRASHDVLEACDTLLMIGTSMPYTAFLPKDERARGVQIDLDPARIGLRYAVEVGLVGDSTETLKALLPLLDRKADRGFLEMARASMREWRAHLAKQTESQAVPMRPQAFAAAISRHLADDAIICGDVGQNTHWAARHLDIRGTQRFSTSGTNASMACGLPYAIGAQIAYPGRQVVAYVGDGGLTMLMGEIATCVKYKLPVKILVSNNNALGLIRWEQMMFLGFPEYGIELQEIDFVKVAEACGATGFRVEKPGDLDEVIAKALATPGPVLVDAVVDPYEPVASPDMSEFADKYGHALRTGLQSGMPNPKGIALTMTREITEDYAENAKAMADELDKDVPELMAASRALYKADAPPAPGEPRATMDGQRDAAPERTSGLVSGSEVGAESEARR